MGWSQQIAFEPHRAAERGSASCSGTVSTPCAPARWEAWGVAGQQFEGRFQ
jgi:hypothetical protein